jgi:PAS domain S-box-containing protein
MSLKDALPAIAAKRKSRRISRASGRVQTLLKENEQVTVLFNQNPDPVVFCDNRFRVLNVNRSFVKLFGYKPEEAQGKNVKELMFHKNLSEEVLSATQNLDRGPIELWTTCYAKDGSEVHVSLSAAPLITKRKVYGYLFMYKDVTDLVFANRELSSIFVEVDRMLNEANLLNEKLVVLGSLTRHDVRNKLAGITNYVYLARKRGGDNQAVERYLCQIGEVVKNTVQILDFAKTFELIGTQERILIDVGQMVNNAVSLFTDLKGITIINECDGFQVYADSLVMELFHNLIDNSFKYGEKLTQIRISVRQVVGGKELIYQDDGVGIDPELRTILFQKGAGKGTGYGLWLIKRICEMYGWNISEEGTLGQGVRFVMFIPDESSKQLAYFGENR